MRPFSYSAPATVDEALTLLNHHRDSVAVAAGGTDLVLALHERTCRPAHVVNISKLNELRYIREEDGLVKLGALTTFDDLERSGYVRENLPALWEMACHVGSPQIRNLGTLGGNVVTASVAGDSPTVLLAYGASVVLKSTAGERILPLDDFNAGPGACAIRPDELLTELRFPAPRADEAAGYAKIGRRKSLAIVVLGTSIWLKKTEDDRIAEARVVLGAVSPHPVRVPAVEAALVGRRLDEAELLETLPLFTQAVEALIPDRASVSYKREAVHGAAHRCFDQIMARFGRK